MAATLPARIVYISDQNAQTVNIFPQRGQNQVPIGTITSGLNGPNGLFVDANNDLYVCNFVGGTVTVYHKQKLTPFRTLTGAGTPIHVVVGLDGTVYVSDWDPACECAGRLLEYAPRHNRPTKVINLTVWPQGLAGPQGLALDQNNNLYVAYVAVSGGYGGVLKFRPGSSIGTNLGIQIAYAGGATIDSNQNLLVVDQGAGGAVDVFPPGSTRPSETITAVPIPSDLALTESDERLWITGVTTHGMAVDIDVRYPSGKIIDTISNTFSSQWGVATSPHGSY